VNYLEISKSIGNHTKCIRRPHVTDPDLNHEGNNSHRLIYVCYQFYHSNSWYISDVAPIQQS